MQIGRKIIHLASVDSTNNYIANALLTNGIESGTVILADEQFAGRGQRGNEWHAEPGENLTFSFLLSNVNMAVEEQFDMNILVSVALSRLLKKQNVDCQIKWPNDIYVGKEKIGGILIENVISGKVIKHSIVGIGLNVNQLEFNNLKATSLMKLTKERKNNTEVLMSFIAVFNDLPINDSLRNEYKSQLFQKNELCNYRSVAGNFRGKIIDVDRNGMLKVEQNGTLNSYAFKEIEFI